MKIEAMLRGLVSLGMVAALTVPLTLAKSQDPPAPQAAGEKMAMGMRDRLQSAVESLNLTDDQKAKVKDIFADAKTKRDAVFNDTSLNPEQKKAKMKELHGGTLAKVNGVLTPEQQADLKNKLEAAKAKPPAQ